MNIIYFLLPLALLLGGMFVAFFIWATKSGQYDDLETPAQRILFDDDRNIK
ncbi:MAG: cytochrome oxidase maturation protein, cbb3-type [Bacteriovorax sp. MedPE-SWde]|nr:MAG: cytochrome oxidase maturation protein, cbb3-type [Bacteriovorax sp. MedPE-SWde]